MKRVETFRFKIIEVYVITVGNVWIDIKDEFYYFCHDHISWHHAGAVVIDRIFNVREKLVNSYMLLPTLFQFICIFSTLCQLIENMMAIFNQILINPR